MCQVVSHQPDAVGLAKGVKPRAFGFVQPVLWFGTIIAIPALLFYSAHDRGHPTTSPGQMAEEMYKPHLAKRAGSAQRLRPHHTVDVMSQAPAGHISRRQLQSSAAAYTYSTQTQMLLCTDGQQSLTDAAVTTAVAAAFSLPDSSRLAAPSGSVALADAPTQCAAQIPSFSGQQWAVSVGNPSTAAQNAAQTAADQIDQVRQSPDMFFQGLANSLGVSASQLSVVSIGFAIVFPADQTTTSTTASVTIDEDPGKNYHDWGGHTLQFFPWWVWILYALFLLFCVAPLLIILCRSERASQVAAGRAPLSAEKLGAVNPGSLPRSNTFNTAALTTNTSGGEYAPASVVVDREARQPDRGQIISPGTLTITDGKGGPRFAPAANLRPNNNGEPLDHGFSPSNPSISHFFRAPEGGVSGQGAAVAAGLAGGAAGGVAAAAAVRRAQRDVEMGPSPTARRQGAVMPTSWVMEAPQEEERVELPASVIPALRRWRAGLSTAHNVGPGEYMPDHMEPQPARTEGLATSGLLSWLGLDKRKHAPAQEPRFPGLGDSTEEYVPGTTLAEMLAEAERDGWTLEDFEAGRVYPEGCPAPQTGLMLDLPENMEVLSSADSPSSETSLERTLAQLANRLDPTGRYHTQGDSLAGVLAELEDRVGGQPRGLVLHPEKRGALAAPSQHRMSWAHPSRQFSAMPDPSPVVGSTVGLGEAAGGGAAGTSGGAFSFFNFTCCTATSPISRSRSPDAPGDFPLSNSPMSQSDKRFSLRGPPSELSPHEQVRVEHAVGTLAELLSRAEQAGNLLEAMEVAEHMFGLRAARQEDADASGPDRKPRWQGTLADAISRADAKGTTLGAMDSDSSVTAGSSFGDRSYSVSKRTSTGSTGSVPEILQGLQALQGELHDTARRRNSALFSGELVSEETPSEAAQKVRRLSANDLAVLATLLADNANVLDVEEAAPTEAASATESVEERLRAPTVLPLVSPSAMKGRQALTELLTTLDLLRERELAGGEKDPEPASPKRQRSYAVRVKSEVIPDTE